MEDYEKKILTLMINLEVIKHDTVEPAYEKRVDTTKIVPFYQALPLCQGLFHESRPKGLPHIRGLYFKRRKSQKLLHCTTRTAKLQILTSQLIK